MASSTEGAITNLEYAHLSPGQRERHTPSRDPAAAEAIRSYVHQSRSPIFWSSTDPMEMECNRIEGSLDAGDASSVTYIYVANTPKYTHLLYTDMWWRTPFISVKEEYRGKYVIAWPHNPANAPINTVLMEVSNVECGPSYGKQWLDAHPQWRRSPGVDVDTHNRSIGNVPALIGWNHSLPSTYVSNDHPMPFSKTSTMAFPIFYWPKEKNITFTYKMFSKVSDVLRMAKVEVKSGVTVYTELSKVDMSVLTIARDATLPRPSLIGRYLFTSPEEMEYLKCETTRTYRAEQIISLRSKPCSIGMEVDIPMVTSTPCRGIFLTAENVTATRRRNFSNYTIDPGYFYASPSAISTITFSYGSNKKFRMPAEYFGGREARHWTCAPTEPGYFVISPSCNPDSSLEEPGLVFNSRVAATLKCNLSPNTGSPTGDSGEIVETKTVSESKGGETEFLVHVHLLCDLYYTISKRGDSDTYDFRIRGDDAVPAVIPKTVGAAAAGR